MEKCAPLSSTLYQLLFDSWNSRVGLVLPNLNYFRRQLYHCCPPGRVDMYDDLSTALLAAWPLAQYVQRLAHLSDDLLDYIGAVAMCAHPFYRSRTRARRQRVARVYY